jgi:hypothetical protein
MWYENEVKCPRCRKKGPFKMFAGKAMGDINRPLPLENRVMVSCPFGTHRFALAKFRQYFTDKEWVEVMKVPKQVLLQTFGEAGLR